MSPRGESEEGVGMMSWYIVVTRRRTEEVPSQRPERVARLNGKKLTFSCSGPRGGLAAPKPTPKGVENVPTGRNGSLGPCSQDASEIRIGRFALGTVPRPPARPLSVSSRIVSSEILACSAVGQSGV
jgi:hypothetical protein